jgi:serine/threonine-protein kinase
LAKRTNADDELTQDGTIMGSVFYMPPEQAAGKTALIGPAADIYALGAILYKLLTGHPPFQAPTTMEILRQVADQEPIPPRRVNPRIPRDLETICLKCLQKDISRRFDSASELVEELERFH